MSFFIEVMVFGLILCADSFSAAIAMGSRPFTRKDALKFAFSSGGAEALATFVGFWAGANIIHLISPIDHWVAFGLLAAVAIHMVMEGVTALRNGTPEEEEVDFHSFAKVLIVSFATSLDAFGVGVTLGIAQKPIAPYIVSIGLWAFIATLVGLYLAKGLSKKFGPVFTLIGAAILGAIAIQMLKI